MFDTLTTALEVRFFVTARYVFPDGFTLGVSMDSSSAHAVPQSRWRHVRLAEDISKFFDLGKPHAVPHAWWIAPGASRNAQRWGRGGRSDTVRATTLHRQIRRCCNQRIGAARQPTLRLAHDRVAPCHCPTPAVDSVPECHHSPRTPAPRSA